jgi:hypothetical protein
MLGLLAALSLVFLNSALFSAWMSGGPPNPYPEAWAFRSQSFFAWSLAAAVGAGAAFTGIRRFPAVGVITKLLLVASAVLAAAPFVVDQLRVDRCLDGGGRWNYEALQCER